MLLCNFCFVWLLQVLLIGAFCPCADFGVCADDDFPRNENMGPVLDMFPILSSSQLKTVKLVAFRTYFIQSEEPTVNFRLESDFLFSFSLCQTKNVTKRPGHQYYSEKKTQKKPPPVWAKPENFGFGKQVVDCQPSNAFPQHRCFLWRTDKKYPISYHQLLRQQD